MSGSSHETVIGLEVHARLLTETKLFCSCANRFGEPPNSLVCPVCLGMPGVLPVLNEEAVHLAVRAGCALRCDIRRTSIFSRKNYFYPDLPKGYQISQFDRPICLGGEVPLPSGGGIPLERLHLEEDAGKSMHPHSGGDRSLVDLNRCGVPLIEIVSTPSIRSPEEAGRFLVALKQILLYAGVSDCNMEEGSLRCDANISIRPAGTDRLGVKTEIKNLNSIRAVRLALGYEGKRQEGILRAGGTVRRETLLWDAGARRSSPMRSKEEADDYRYFPEPDLPPLRLAEDRIETIRHSLPEMPAERRARFRNQYGLRLSDAEILTGSRALADYFEETVREWPHPAELAKFLSGHFLRALRDKGAGVAEVPVEPRDVAALLELEEEGAISTSTAKDLFDAMWESGKGSGILVDELGLRQISGEGRLSALVAKVLDENRPQVRLYLDGGEKLFGFFMGLIMKESSGRANPRALRPILRRALENRRNEGC